MVVGKAHFLPVNLTHILWVPAFPCLIMASNNFMVGVKRVIKVFIGLPVTPGAPWEAPLIILAKVLDWKHLVSSLIWTTTILLFLPHFNDLAALKSTITGPVATGFLTVILTVGFLTVILAVGFLTVTLALATGFLTIICNILRPALALTLSLTFGTLIFNPDLTESTAFLAPRLTLTAAFFVALPILTAPALMEAPIFLAPALMAAPIFLKPAPMEKAAFLVALTALVAPTFNFIEALGFLTLMESLTPAFLTMEHLPLLSLAAVQATSVVAGLA